MTRATVLVVECSSWGANMVRRCCQIGILEETGHAKGCVGSGEPRSPWTPRSPGRWTTSWRERTPTCLWRSRPGPISSRRPGPEGQQEPAVEKPPGFRYNEGAELLGFASETGQMIRVGRVLEVQSALVRLGN